MKYLAVALAFAVIVFATMFRYEYSDAYSRTDRWTGNYQILCTTNEWAAYNECNKN